MEQADLALLPALDALLQEASVTGAAKRLNLSKPAVSYLLGRLRDELGDPLLVRSGRSMVLTPFAEDMRVRVHDLHAEARQLLLPKEPVAPEELRRTFTIRCTDYVLTLLGKELDRHLRENAPGVHLQFVPNAKDDVEALDEGEADLAVGIYGQLPATLRSRMLLTDRHVCVARKNHEKIGKKLTLRQFTTIEHIQIAPRGTPGGYIDDLLDDLETSRVVARAVPYFVSALQLVSETDYLLTVSERIAVRYAKELKLELHALPFENEPYALNLLWHPRFDGDPGHQFLRESLAECSAKVAGDRHARSRRRL